MCCPTTGTQLQKLSAKLFCAMFATVLTAIAAQLPLSPTPGGVMAYAQPGEVSQVDDGAKRRSVLDRKGQPAAARDLARQSAADLEKLNPRDLIDWPEEERTRIREVAQR